MTTFKEMGLCNEIYQAIDELGFETPTPIQEKTIPAILSNKNDLIGLAQTGTGKTAGFGLPIIHQIDTNNRSVQALVLCPTRELCMQITKDLKAFSKYIRNFSVLAVYGGGNISTQLKSLREGVHIVVGTPGRSLDLINRGSLLVNNIKWLVLDEADEMLNMGFKDELDGILAVTPKVKQTMLFSATMLPGVRQIASNYMNNSEEISVGKMNSGADNVLHQYYMVKSSDRYLVMKRLADVNPNIYGIVFCRTRRETQEVADQLIADGYNADALHGDLSQLQRDSVMQKFRSKHLQLLIATDVAARGLDVTDLTHIINYNLPDDPEIYIHRSGRTGRAGKSGISISIITSREHRRIKDIEKMLSKKFDQKMIPSGREICEKRLYNLIDIVENVTIDDTQIDSFLPIIYKKLEWLDRNELIKRFVSVEFNRFLEYYKDSEDLNVSKNEFSDKDKSSKRSGRKEFVRFHVNLGNKQKISTAQLIGIINEATGTRNIEIGKIDIFGKFSFFEVDKAYQTVILDSFKSFNQGETKVEVRLSKPDPREDNRDTFKKDKAYENKDYSFKDKKPWPDSKPAPRRSNTNSSSDKIDAFIKESFWGKKNRTDSKSEYKGPKSESNTEKKDRYKKENSYGNKKPRSNKNFKDKNADSKPKRRRY